MGKSEEKVNGDSIHPISHSTQKSGLAEVHHHKKVQRSRVLINITFQDILLCLWLRVLNASLFGVFHVNVVHPKVWLCFWKDNERKILVKESLLTEDVDSREIKARSWPQSQGDDGSKGGLSASNSLEQVKYLEILPSLWSNLVPVHILVLLEAFFFSYLKKCRSIFYVLHEFLFKYELSTLCSFGALLKTSLYFYYFFYSQ